MALYLTKMLSKLLVLLQAILLMSGCAAFMGFPPRVTDRSEDLKALQRHIDADAITECLKTLNEAEGLPQQDHCSKKTAHGGINSCQQRLSTRGIMQFEQQRREVAKALGWRPIREPWD